MIQAEPALMRPQTIRFSATGHSTQQPVAQRTSIRLRFKWFGEVKSDDLSWWFLRFQWLIEPHFHQSTTKEIQVEVGSPQICWKKALTLRLPTPPMETPDPPNVTPRKGPPNRWQLDTPNPTSQGVLGNCKRSEGLSQLIRKIRDWIDQAHGVQSSTYLHRRFRSHLEGKNPSIEGWKFHRVLESMYSIFTYIWLICMVKP